MYCDTCVAMGAAVPVGGLAGTPGKPVTRAPPCAYALPPWLAGVIVRP